MRTQAIVLAATMLWAATATGIAPQESSPEALTYVGNIWVGADTVIHCCWGIIQSPDFASIEKYSKVLRPHSRGVNGS